MRCAFVCTYALILSCIASFSSAADPPATQPAGVRATTIDGRKLEGRWLGVGPAGELQIQTAPEGPVSIPRDDAMSLRFGQPSTSQPSVSDRPVFYLADGSRFAGQIVEGGQKALTVRSRLAGALAIPLAQLAGVRFGDIDAGDAADFFTRALAQRSASEDVLIAIREGRATAVRGVIEQLTVQGGSFRWRERSVPFQWETTYGLVVARGVQPATIARVLCLLRDGSLWGGDVISGDEATIRFKSSLGVDLELPVADAWEIRFRSERIVLLSDLPPAEYQFEPFAVTQWPYRYDRSVANRPLRIGGQEFERGIGMHSQSRLRYDLSEDFAQLAATIGIDDSVRPRGNAVFRVLADDKEVFNSGPVSGRDPPRAILVDLNKPKRLELRVDFGEGLDVADHADWGLVRLIR